MRRSSLLDALFRFVVAVRHVAGGYIGRTCRWKDCRPGVRQSGDARHCGRRAHLHDDLDALTLSASVIAVPPVTLWPVVERRQQLPPDLETCIAALEHQ
jgi:hypothetical protein